MQPAAQPAIIHGEIRHCRHRPVENAFAYRAFCLRLPLSQIGRLEALGLALNRRAMISLHERDHGQRDGSPLAGWIRTLLGRAGIDAGGEIVLYTFPRMLGYVFNPVSFWVCHDRAGAARAVLCEVSNTFGERHNYLVAHPDGRVLASGDTLSARKVFHVSPFCEVRGSYRFRFHFGPDRWLARIEYFDDAGDPGGSDGAPLLTTAVSGRAEALTPASLARLPWRYRWYTLGVITRIHWQALRLWIKRVPFHSKPAPPAEEITR